MIFIPILITAGLVVWYCRARQEGDQVGIIVLSLALVVATFLDACCVASAVINLLCP